MSNTKYDVQKGNKGLQNLQNNILRNNNTIRDNMQKFLVAATIHAKETGDCSAVGRLFNALGKRPSINVRAARVCIEALTSIRLVTRGKADAKEIKSVLAKDDNGQAIQVTAKMVDAIKSANWADFQPDVEETIVGIDDLNSRVGNIVSLIDRLLKGEAKNQTLLPKDKDKAVKLRSAIKAAQATINMENMAENLANDPEWGDAANAKPAELKDGTNG